MEERRLYPRIYLDILVNYAVKAKAQSVNISETGLCIITEKGLEKDSYQTLTFTLPDETEELKIYGKVIWEKRNDKNLYESGIEFWHITDNDIEKIKKYCNKQSKK